MRERKQDVTDRPLCLSSEECWDVVAGVGVGQCDSPADV